MGTSRANSSTAALDLTAVVTNVLEDLAFMVSDEGPPRPMADTLWLECEISYEGPFRGTLMCWCTRDFAVQLAANLLGADPEDAAVHEQIGDALREFMNVVCGQFVTAYHGSEPVFDLSIPTTEECSLPPILDVRQEPAACVLSVSGEPFYCVFRTGEGNEA